MCKVYFNHLLFILLCPLLLIAQDSSSQKSDYMESVVNKFHIDSSKIYYVTDKSAKEFITNMQSSILAFVKGNQSTSVDAIKVKSDTGEDVSLNSCNADKTVSNTLIESFLTTEKNYKGLVLKNLKTGNLYSLPKDRTIAVLLFSKKMGSFVEPYIFRSKTLQEKENIDYIIITMDEEDLNEIKNIFKNSFD